MCSRYTFRREPKPEELEPSPWRDLWEGVKAEKPRYNIAPTQLAPIVTASGAQEMAFGIKPEWSKSILINAKVENLLSSRFWQPMAALRPCLIPTDGFYEPKGKKGTKRPWYGFEMDESEPFFFAGIYGKQADHEQFVIITKEPNLIVGEVHSRMPVILDSSQVDTCTNWLNTELELNNRVGALGEQIEYGCLTSFPVSEVAKNPSFDKASLFLRHTND